MLSSVEMGGSWNEIVARLATVREYVASFGQIYAGGIDQQNIKDAIATYERSLITPDAPFDQYLRGDDQAISEKSRRGYALFKSFGCVGCHQGINVGGNMYQRLGVMEPELNWYQGSDDDSHHLGRYNVTGRDRDKQVFKVPSLRNVAETAPYFHDGSVESLDTAVAIMARLQLGRILTKVEREEIVAFLQSLTGTFQWQSLVSK